MLSVTSYTKAGMRIAVFGGMIMAFISLLIGLIYLILKLIYWDRFDAGQAPTIIIISLIGSILLAFMGFLGEYISAINMRMMHRPLVIEEERLNFDEPEKNEGQRNDFGFERLSGKDRSCDRAYRVQGELDEHGAGERRGESDRIFQLQQDGGTPL